MNLILSNKQADYEYKTPLRELMLDVHERKVKEIYEIPWKHSLAYDDDSTQIWEK